MSSFNKLMSRKEKGSNSTVKNVMSQPAEPILSSPCDSASSFSSSLALSGFYRGFDEHRRSSSLSSLSSAFPAADTKRSPRLQASTGTIESSTANSCDLLLLQPKHVSGSLDGSISGDEDRRISDEETDDVNRARLPSTSFGDRLLTGSRAT